MADGYLGATDFKLLKGIVTGGGAINKSGDKMSKDKKIKVLKMIADDMKNDAKNFDGKPFNGKVVAEYFGHQGAAISALAKTLKSFIEENV